MYSQMVTKENFVNTLNNAYSMNLSVDDIVTNYDGQYTIDGMNPYEWCDAMTME